MDLEVRGLAQLKQALLALPQKMQTRIVKGMVATGASVFRIEAISRAPYYTGPVQQGHPPAGTLKAAIYQTRVVSECTDTREVWRVSVHKGNAQAASGRDAYYASWVEFGHYTRGPSARTKAQRTGVETGAATTPLGTYYIMAQPFMRPAFEVKKQAAVDAMRDYLAAQLPQVWKEAA